MSPPSKIVTGKRLATPKERLTLPNTYNTVLIPVLKSTLKPVSIVSPRVRDADKVPLNVSLTFFLPKINDLIDEIKEAVSSILSPNAKYRDSSMFLPAFFF